MAKVMTTGHTADDHAPTALYHFVDGQRVPGESNRFGDVYNPATAEVIAHAPYASAHEVDYEYRRDEYHRHWATSIAERRRSKT